MTIFFLCLKIFLARILDVSIGTVRTIITVKGKSVIAGILAFLEALIWFIIVKEALNTEISSIWIPLSYAAGFGCGTFIGTKLSAFIKGIIGVQIITSNFSNELVEKIKAQNIAVSIINLNDNQKKMLFIQINNYRLKELIKIVKQMDEKAFIIVNETKYVQNGFIK